jgi:hypothetical protein
MDDSRKGPHRVPTRQDCSNDGTRERSSDTQISTGKRIEFTFVAEHPPDGPETVDVTCDWTCHSHYNDHDLAQHLWFERSRISWWRLGAATIHDPRLWECRNTLWRFRESFEREQNRDERTGTHSPKTYKQQRKRLEQKHLGAFFKHEEQYDESACSPKTDEDHLWGSLTVIRGHAMVCGTG